MSHKSKHGDPTFNLLSGTIYGRKIKPDLCLKIYNPARQTFLGSSVKVANQGATRRKGLLGQTHLAPGEGLWIIPCEAIHTFGMQFPIDLVYLDRKNRVKKLRSNVRPWRLSVCLTAYSVLELASGTIRNTRTQRGDILEVSAE
jgi:uncharacterized membrane protein (UPF0127 family)